MSKRKGYNCPVCDDIFSKEQLELHVEQHFTENEEHERMKKCIFEGCNLEVASEEWEDHLLAHKMFGNEREEDLHQTTSEDALLAIAMQQQETEENIKKLSADEIFAKSLQEEENKNKEKEDFRLLQKKYGMSNEGGGYSKQFQNSMQKNVGKNISIGEYFEKKSNMMCSMITGEDTNETRTQGIIPVLTGVYTCGMNGISRAYLCSECDHYSSDISDKGWGCGYRNIQMLWSSLLKSSTCKELIVEKTGLCQVPAIPRLQNLIETAWKDGFDVSGQEQLGGRLNGTKKWIGATEITALLRWIGIRARIVDFHKGLKDNTHPLLFEWVENYYKKNQTSDTKGFPLYLQHDGHSRTVIGLEEHNGGAQSAITKALLLFDPSLRKSKMDSLKNLKMPCSKTQIKELRKSLKQMKHSQFQIVFIDGIYGDKDERERSKILSSIRIASGKI